MKQTRKRYALMIVALLTFGVFGAVRGTISPTHAVEGQSTQSEATSPDEETDPRVAPAAR